MDDKRTEEIQKEQENKSYNEKASFMDRQEIDLPIKIEREQKIAELKAELNSLYLRIKANQTEYSVLTRNYTELLKALEIEITKTNF